MRTPFYPQLEERDCGATCLRMVLAHHGVEVPMSRLRALSATDERGTDLAGLSRAAKALNFETIAADLSFEELLAPDLWPVILHWDGDHFVVVTRALPDRVDLLDPALGERRLDRETFEGYRLGAGRSRAGLVLSPPKVRERSDAVRAGAVDAPTDRPPYEVWASAFLFAGVLAAGLYAVVRVLRLAVDLQFREAWLSNFGALLFVSAAVILGRYLVRRSAITYGGRTGRQDTDALLGRLRENASDPSRSGDPALALRLVEDIDTVRIWRAYRLAEAHTASATIVLAGVFAFSIDAVWAFALIGVGLVVGLTYFYHGIAGADVKQLALRAQVAQRDGIAEFTRVVPEVTRLRGVTDWVVGRFVRRNEAASAAYARFTAEVVARTDLKLTVTVVGAVALFSLALYRLGYAGLQVGDLVFLIALNILVFSQIKVLADAWRAYGRTSDSRKRLADMLADRAHIVAPEPGLSLTEGLSISWRGATAGGHVINFGAAHRIAFTGSDVGLRRALIEACLGRANALDARLRIPGDRSDPVALTRLGSVAWLSTDSPLVAGSLADNIILDEAVDHVRLDLIAQRLGLLTAALPEGLATRIDGRASQLDNATFVKTIVARALYAGATIIIVDGITDALPSYQEATLFDEVLAAVPTGLVICNARRASATVGFDLIVQLEAGEVEAIGSHEALVVGRSAYAFQFGDPTSTQS